MAEFILEPSEEPEPFLQKCIKKAELVAYEDLQSEALGRLYVEDMPLVVLINSEGRNLYEEEGRPTFPGKETDILPPAK